MRRGITFTEVLIVITLVALVTLIVVPRSAGLLARITAETEAHRIAAAHMRARLTAIASGRVVLLRLTRDSLTIARVEGSDTIPDWAARGPGDAGAELSGPTRPLLFTPTGVTFGLSNGTWTVTCRDAVRKVIVSRLGRVRVE